MSRIQPIKISMKWKWNRRHYQKMKLRIMKDIWGEGKGPLRKAMKQWAKAYRTFAHKRFIVQSRGGWTALSRPRKKGKRSRAKGILRVSGTLLGALKNPFRTGRGAIEDHVPGGVRIGYGGPVLHPTAVLESKRSWITIAKLAELHQIGAGRLPARPIIVTAPPSVIAKMTELSQKALNKIADDFNVRKR